MDKQGLELYKLCCTEDNACDAHMADEIGWINNTSFCVWVSYLWIKEFLEELEEIFGYGIFDDGGFTANIQSDYVCIDLCEAIGSYLDLEEVFPKEKYQH